MFIFGWIAQNGSILIPLIFNHAAAWFKSLERFIFHAAAWFKSLERFIFHAAAWFKSLERFIFHAAAWFKSLERFIFYFKGQKAGIHKILHL